LSIRVPEGVEAAALTGKTVFIIARPAGSTARMPTAVDRVVAADWPLSATLTDDNSMAGQKLSALALVDLEVQVSDNGQPGVDNARFTGELRGVSVRGKAIAEIVLRVNAQ